MMRKMTQFCAALGFGVVGCILTTQAKANITTYSYFYIPGQTNYTVAPNSDLVIPVFLQEVNSDQSTNSLLVNEDGLSAAGVNVSFFSGAASTIITGAAANTGAVPNGFDDPGSIGNVNSITSATITESTDPFPFGPDLVGVAAGPQTNGVSEVYLGTVTIQASSLPSQVTTFTVGVADPSFSNTFTNDNSYDLDFGSQPFYSDAAAQNFTVTTTASSDVPEPATLSLLMVGLALISRPRWQRKGMRTVAS